jgi:glycerophosphoryl diester phosphodiesterase
MAPLDRAGPQIDPLGGPGPLVVAHRGAWGDAPQNSLKALSDAITLGCEMAELDVRATRDGRLVAVHDARVHGVPVEGQDLDELRERMRPGQAPLLEEIVELAAGRIALDVELKKGHAEPVLATLAGGLEPETYVVTSFLDDVLASVRALAPEIRTGLLLRPGRPARQLETRLERTGAAFLGLPASLARAGLLAWAANRGRTSYVWTVNDRRALRSTLTDARVEAVITDRPRRALELRRELFPPPDR